MNKVNFTLTFQLLAVQIRCVWSHSCHNFCTHQQAWFAELGRTRERVLWGPEAGYKWLQQLRCHCHQRTATCAACSPSVAGLDLDSRTHACRPRNYEVISRPKRRLLNPSYWQITSQKLSTKAKRSDFEKILWYFVLNIGFPVHCITLTVREFSYT